MGFDELKKVLFSEILVENRKKEMLIEAYINSPRYVRRLAKEGTIPVEALDFLENNIQKLVDTPAQITIQFFRNAKYEELIDLYCTRKANEQLEKECAKTPVIKNVAVTPAKETEELTRPDDHYGTVEAKAKEWLIKNWNIKAKSFMKDLIEATESGNIVWVESKSEKSFYVVLGDYRKIKIRRSDHKGKTSYSLTRDKKDQISEKNYSKLYEVIKGKPYKANSKKDNKEEPENKRQVKIGFKDFVVRRNIFKCMHNKHSIEDIDAVVKIMNKNAEIEEMTVAAGYCKQCNMFFMMESTYQQLRRKGIVVFRAIDEKNYLNQNYLNGKLLAQESILMQFGYSVSQAEGLSEERRHKILSVLVDNHILTKSEIISYLDFFINQRKNDKFAMAVAK